MTCREVDELAAAYVLGALPPEERDRLEEHLRTCAAHEETLRHLFSTAGSVAYGIEEIEPPASLKAGVLAAVEAGTGSAAAPPSQPPAPTQTVAPAKRRWFRFSPAVAMLAALVAGLLVWNLALQSSGDDDAFVRYMRSEADSRGWVYYVQEVGVVTMQGLPPLDGASTYQAWAVLDGELVDLGTIPLSETGDGFVLLDRHVSAQAPVFVTIEPSGGSAQPTGPTVLTTERPAE